MKAIGLDQPYATLIACGVKTMETRHFEPTRLGLRAGERIAIHANKTTRMLPVCIREAADAMKAAGLTFPYLPPGPIKHWDPVQAARDGYLPLGALVATATLSMWGRTEQVRADVGAVERSVGDYSPGRWAWQLTDIERLESPVPWKGRQGAFEVTL